MKEGMTLFRTIPGERFTPVTLARKLNANVLLESASFHSGRERYSILSLNPAFSIYEKKNKVYMLRDGKHILLKNTGQDILDVLLYFADQHKLVKQSFPFPVGGVGYLSYEYARRFDTVKLTELEDSLAMPDAHFIFGHIFVVFDHYTDTMILVGVNYKEHMIDLVQALDETEQRINDLDFNFLNMGNKQPVANIISSLDKKWYLEGVDSLRSEIIKGNLFQAVLSHRLVVETELPALEAYRNLRSSNPSPYMFYLNYGDFQLFGASPEVHVKTDGRRLIMRPIAGTRRRGKDRNEDDLLAADLLSDKKELAEHLMLVDLARNDMGRVAIPGSVSVTESNIIEHYSHVMHIVSQVEAEMMSGINGLHAVRATFPAGTVSGAPKIEAMETLSQIEKSKRGFYAGIVGYVEPDGSLDTCISIRSAVKKDNCLILQAGAGVVYDSSPEKEFEETQNKLRALAVAAGIDL